MFENIKKGDRVRLVYEFTVDEIDSRGTPNIYTRETGSSYYANKDELVSVEKLTPPLPTEDGWYESERYPLSEGYNPYELREGRWYTRGGAVAINIENKSPLYKLGRIATENT